MSYGSQGSIETYGLLTHFLPAKVWTCVFHHSCHHVYFCVRLFLCPCWHKMPSPLDLHFKHRTIHASTGSDLLYKTLHSIQSEYILYIYTNTHTDCIQLKPRASICVYCDFLCQVREPENSIFMAQRTHAHWHISKAEQTELHGSHCKAFLPAQA